MIGIHSMGKFVKEIYTSCNESLAQHTGPSALRLRESNSPVRRYDMCGDGESDAFSSNKAKT